MPDEEINFSLKNIRESIYGVSEQFMDDVKVIFDKIRNNSMIVYDFRYGLVSGAFRFDIAEITNFQD